MEPLYKIGRPNKWDNATERIKRHREMAELLVQRYIDARETNYVENLPEGFITRDVRMGPGTFRCQWPLGLQTWPERIANRTLPEGVTGNWEDGLDALMVGDINWWTAERRVFSNHIPDYHHEHKQFWITEDGWIQITTYGGVIPDTVRSRSLGLANKLVLTTEQSVYLTNEQMQVERWDMWTCAPAFDPLLQLVGCGSGYFFEGWMQGVINEAHGRGVDFSKPAETILFGGNWVVDGQVVPVPGQAMAPHAHAL